MSYLSSPITRTLSTLQPPSSSCVAKSIGWSTYLDSLFDLLLHRMVGYKPDVLTPHEDVYPRGGNAYALANHITSQSMFNAGQSLCVIVLDSASLLISI